jgi:hypothetical protein
MVGILLLILRAYYGEAECTRADMGADNGGNVRNHDLGGR